MPFGFVEGRFSLANKFWKDKKQPESDLSEKLQAMEKFYSEKKQQLNEQTGKRIKAQQAVDEIERDVRHRRGGKYTYYRSEELDAAHLEWDKQKLQELVIQQEILAGPKTDGWDEEHGKKEEHAAAAAKLEIDIQLLRKKIEDAETLTQARKILPEADKERLEAVYKEQHFVNVLSKIYKLKKTLPKDRRKVYFSSSSSHNKSNDLQALSDIEKDAAELLDYKYKPGIVKAYDKRTVARNAEIRGEPDAYDAVEDAEKEFESALQKFLDLEDELEKELTAFEHSGQLEGAADAVRKLEEEIIRLDPQATYAEKTISDQIAEKDLMFAINREKLYPNREKTGRLSAREHIARKNAQVDKQLRKQHKETMQIPLGEKKSTAELIAEAIAEADEMMARARDRMKKERMRPAA